MIMTSIDSNASPLEPDALAALIDMVGLDDPEFLVELIDTFLNDSSTIVNSLVSDWANNDRETVMRSAHSLKSTSATFQATYLSELSAELESEMRGDTTGIDVPAQIDLIVAEHARVKDALALERTKLR